MSRIQPADVSPTRLPDIDAWLRTLATAAQQRIVGPAFLKPFHFVTLGLALKRTGGQAVLPDAVAGYAVRMGLWEAIGINPPR